MRTFTADIETLSVRNLRDCGADIYASDPSTDVICLCYAVDDDEPQVWTPAEPTVPAIFREIVADPKAWEVVVHNWGFDLLIYDRVMVMRYRFPPIPRESWHCTQRLALANGLPAELDRLAEALGQPYRKDPAARKAMLAVSRPMKVRNGKKGTTTPVFDKDPAKIMLTIQRCIGDILATRAAYRSPKLKRLSRRERYYQLQDLVIN